MNQLFGGCRTLDQLAAHKRQMNKITHFDFDWQSAAGMYLFGQAWVPAEPVAVLLVAHGFGEHSGRYAEAADFVASRYNFALVGFDQPGHGKSGGPRGYIKDLTTFGTILNEAGNLVQEKLPYPMFVWGHSMGGGMLLHYLAGKPKLPAKAAVVSSPWVDLAVVPTITQKLLANFGSTFSPKLTQLAALDVTQLSRVPEVGEKYKNDPLVHKEMSARLFQLMTNNGKWLKKAKPPLADIPLLLMHGEADKITALAATKALAEHYKTTSKFWPEARHELHNELNRDEVLTFMGNWLKYQL